MKDNVKMRHLAPLVRHILLTSLISAVEVKINVKMKRLVRLVHLISPTSLISAVKIKNKCKNEASWASCLSYFD